MQTNTHHAKNHAPTSRSRSTHQLRASRSALLKPIKNANKKVMYYVKKNPGLSVGIATLVATFLAGIIYAKIRLSK